MIKGRDEANTSDGGSSKKIPFGPTPGDSPKLFRLFLDPEVDPFWIVEVGEVKGP